MNLLAHPWPLALHRAFPDRCALQHHRKNKKCFVCGQPTGGYFTPAKDLQAKLKERDEQLERQELAGEA